MGGEYTVLGGFQVIRRAQKVDNLRFGVEECRGGTPVSVARLADGAGIDHVTSIRLQLQTGRLSLAYSAVFGAKPVGRIIQKKSALEMRMAKKCNQSAQKTSLGM